MDADKFALTGLFFLFFIALILIRAPRVECSPFNVTVDFQLPLGVRYEEVQVEKGATVIGWLTLTELGYEELELEVRLRLDEGLVLAYSSHTYKISGNAYVLKYRLRETVPFTWSFILRTPSTEGAYRVTVIVELRRKDTLVYRRELSRVLLLGGGPGVRAIVTVRAPVNPDGSYDPKACTGVFVVEELSENPLLYFLGLAGKYTSLIGFARIDVDLGSSAACLPVTIQATLLSADGRPARGVTLVHPGYEGEVPAEGPSLLTYVKADDKGRIAIVVPLIALERPEDLEGDYVLSVSVRRLGSDVEIGSAKVPLKVVVVRRGDVGAVMVGALASVALLAAVFLDAFRRLETLEVAYAALSASLAFAVTSIPGTIVWPAAQALLGPFDWVLTGVLYGFLLYAVYSALVKSVPRPGVFTLAVTTKWLLYLLVFGARNPFMSLVWLATTAFIMEPLLYLLGGTRRGSTLGIALAFALGRFVDAYVDINLYMVFYRLFYAQWYINLYCLGVSAYTFLGSLLGCRLAEKLRGVSHE